MSNNWPGDWSPKKGKSGLPAGEKTGPSYTNDNGIRCLTGDNGEEFLFMSGDIPENTC